MLSKRYSGEVEITIRLDGNETVYVCDVVQGYRGSTVTLPIEFEAGAAPQRKLDPDILDDVAVAALMYARMAEPDAFPRHCLDAKGIIYVGRTKHGAWLC
jgi:hypothetical protein